MGTPYSTSSSNEKDGAAEAPSAGLKFKVATHNSVTSTCVQSDRHTTGILSRHAHMGAPGKFRT
eukprot:CAMPEP_0183714412 /NCGR_PEP_ID=MMETSP0737-20130205/8931_1 /TAXON_ID=385413 /ORGANISM="Thalassiosira miniscula, Strain CCMP1093" /LENGTH=63 /DNA_ID=CAMNT_0025943331 /DNA_START=231 /DNA_END=422 /DNA_ORIENTATION=+